MSCGLDVLSAPLGAFALFLLGTEIRFGTLCSVDSVQSKPHMGHGLGQGKYGGKITLDISSPLQYIVAPETG